MMFKAAGHAQPGTKPPACDQRRLFSWSTRCAQQELLPAGLRGRAKLGLGGMSPWDLAWATWTRLNDHDAMTLAAAVAFYAMLATVPFLGVLLVGLILRLPDVSEVRIGETGLGNLTVAQLDTTLQSLFPYEASILIRDQIARIQNAPPLALLSVGALISLWSASSLFLVVIDALNRTYGVKETRSFVRLRLTAMGMTLLEAACLMGSLVAIVAEPQILRVLGFRAEDAATWVATTVRWAAIFLTVLVSFGLTFQLGPAAPKHRAWLTPGSLLGTVAFLVFCVLFRVYVQNFGSYNKSLGALGAVMVLLLWFWCVALVFLSAAELDRAIEAGTPGRPDARLD
jgi:membrane protein